MPCVIAILLTPYLIYLIDPPGVKDTPEAPIKAAEQLKAMGGLKNSEKKMLAGLGVTVVLWVFGAQLGVSAVLAAMLGLVLLLSTGVVSEVSAPRAACNSCLNFVFRWSHGATRRLAPAAPNRSALDSGCKVCLPCKLLLRPLEHVVWMLDQRRRARFRVPQVSVLELLLLECSVLDSHEIFFLW